MDKCSAESTAARIAEIERLISDPRQSGKSPA